MPDLEEVNGQIEFEQFLASLKPTIRKLRPIEADWVLEKYEDKEEKAGRSPYRIGWMKEVELYHDRHDLILAAYLKSHPIEEKGKGKK